jgi:light-regulated signal transduction histidine kinase (bacteriophytochrome)
MANEPTDEALEQRVKELEEQALEHKRAEAKLKHHVAELERTNRELKQFVYGVSRAFQEPLDRVMMYLRFVEARYKDRLDSDGREFVAAAVDGADRMQTLIGDLSAYFTFE